jgi:hypothetical protein
MVADELKRLTKTNIFISVLFCLSCQTIFDFLLDQFGIHVLVICEI